VKSVMKNTPADFNRCCIRPSISNVSKHDCIIVRPKASWASLILSLPIRLRLYSLPYWSNSPFLIFDIRALWRSGLSARTPECHKLKAVGQTSMALNPLNSSNLEKVALKGLICHAHQQYRRQ